jgi:hypothetical protein
MRFDQIQSFDDGGDVEQQPMQFNDIQPEQPAGSGAPYPDSMLDKGGPAYGLAPEDQPPQTGPIGAAVAGAAPAAAPILSGIAAGARTMAAIPGPWGIAAGLGVGLVASGVVGKIQDWLRDQYGPSTGPLSKPYEAAAEQQNPIAYNIGRAAPIAAGMGTGIGAVDAAGNALITPLVRAVSGGAFGAVDVLQQGITKGFGNIDPTEALTQAAAGAILPKAREWAGGSHPVASNAAGTSESHTPPPGARIKPEGDSPDPRGGATINMEGSATEAPKQDTSPGQSDQGGIPGAQSVPLEPVKDVPSDVAEALGPEQTPTSPAAPVPPPGEQAPGPALAQGAQLSAPSPQPPVQSPSATPTPTPAETGLEGAEVPQQPSPQPGEATPSGLEGQVVLHDAHLQVPPHVAMWLNQPEIQAAINGPVDRSMHVPAMAGSSTDNVTTLIDSSVPVKAYIPSGTFDTAPPLQIHEQIEKPVLQFLTANGMDPQAAYKVAHWDFAEPAEDAYYRSIAEKQGADPDTFADEAEAFWDRQEKTTAKNKGPVAPDIFEKPIEDNAHPTEKPTTEEQTLAAKLMGIDAPELAEQERAAAKPEPGDVAPAESIEKSSVPQAENTPFSEIAPEPAPEIAPESGKGPIPGDINDIRNQPWNRIQPEDEGPEGVPHSLGAGAVDDAAAAMEKANGQDPPPHGAEQAADVENAKYGRAPFRARRAAETYLNNTWFGKILSPTTMDKTGQVAKADIRERRGAIRRTQDAFDAALGKPMEDLIGALPADQQREIQIAMQEANPMERLASFPELEPAIRAMRMTAKKDETFIRANGKLDPDQFQKWYFPQMWKNPDQANAFYDNYMARQGSGAGLKAKQYPDIPTGLADGMELKHDNPIAAFRERRNGMYQYLMMNNLLETGIEREMVTATKTADNVPLLGRGLGNRQLYAPEGYATVFNNAYSPGWRSTPAGKQFMDLAQPTTNWGTGVLLGMSAFHPFTMLNEGFVNDVALAAQQGLRDPALALKTLATSPGGAYKIYRGGIDIAKEWNDRGLVPELTKIVDLYEDANGRAIGHSDPTYRFLPEGWKSVTKEWKGAADDLQASFANAKTPGENATAAAMAPLIVGKSTLRTVGAIMDTVAKPLFGHVIPMMKNGAFRSNMGEWLIQNPQAGHAEQVQAAMNIIDDIDNRFGLMTHDNIFWNNKLKEGLQLGLTSYSWQMGFGRNVGGGVAQWALHPTRFSMKSPDYDPRLGSTLALAVTVAAMSGAYQFLKTGEPPKDINDLLAGRTGGKTASGQPERAILPGFQKDVYGWLHDPLGEAQNKLGVVPKTALEIATNKGWTQTSKGPRYGLISNPQASLPTRLGQKATHAAKNFIPIVGQQLLGNNANQNSNIGLGGRALAIRPAPRYINPGGNVAEDKFIQRDWKITHPEEAKSRANRKLTPAQ